MLFVFYHISSKISFTAYRYFFKINLFPYKNTVIDGHDISGVYFQTLLHNHSTPFFEKYLASFELLSYASSITDKIEI